jgi:hypothetical protein
MSAAPPPPPAAPESKPLPPWWWTEPTAATSAATKPASSPPSPAAAPSPPPASAAAMATLQEPAMSFQEWLRTMGAVEPQPVPPPVAEEPPPEPTPGEPDEAVALLAEPSETANDVRVRASYPLRQKTHERTAAKRGPGPLGIVLGAFGVGLILGALAMRRARLPVGAPESATPGRLL